MTRRAVFLDRDGVLNRSVVRDGKPYPPSDLDGFVLYPGTREALCRLRAQGFLLIVATNQPDVGRGLQSRDTVEAMHDRLRAALPLDDVKVCYEEQRDAARYKPQPGMLLEAAREHGIDLGRSYMVGDRWRDVDCGHAAGCFAIHVDRGYDEALRLAPHARCADLPAAAAFILDHAETLISTGAAS